ncbi:odorant receptor 46a-like [Harpegnathos saltator]|uniref:odorant receptor 46a-like n=1 Tax=Harpegnathos saltator TaxID=610380 RepID=UPI000DBED24D|nr:odorant receptor 46a-like [Harpegnathos saltator]
MTTVVCMIFTSVFVNFMRGNLTYPAWFPFNYTAPIIFPLVFFHQTTAITIGATVNVTCDSLICGLLLHVCCQLEILGYRLMQIPQKRHILSDCILHHDRIFEYACMVNDQFMKIIALQFGVSTLVMCSNLFQLAIATIDANIVPLILYTACTLSQIFIYCWFGNEIKIKTFFHGPDIPIPSPPTNPSLPSLDNDIPVENNVDFKTYEIDPVDDNSPKPFNQSALNDLVRDIGLSKESTELPGSRLKERHLLES